MTIFRSGRPLFAVLWAILIVGLCAGLLSRPALAQTADTLDVNAKIRVVTAGEPDVSGDFLVDTNGDITMLYVNQIHLKGLTVAQAREAIRKKLSKFYRNPQIVVTLLSGGGVNVEVTGDVANQGTRVVRSDARLNDVLQLTQPAVDADLSGVVLTRGLPGEARTKVSVNYLSFLNDKNDEGNPRLKDGDTIYVPRKGAVPIQINIRGEAAKPGRSAVAASTRAYDALQTAGGGLTLGAAKKGIAIQHANSTELIPFDYEAAARDPNNSAVNPILLDGDTIVIPAAEIVNTFIITGAVLRAGSEIPISTARFTIADGIAKAGGLADRARLKETTITRRDLDGKVKVVKLDISDKTLQANTQVQPGDIINIPQGRPGFSPDPLQILGLALTFYGIFGLGRR